jgi:Rhs element Vgr protein
MSARRTIPSEAPRTVVTCTVISNGNEVSKSYHLLSLHIFKEINRIPGATLVYADGDAAQETFPVSNASDFVPGAVIEIKLGYRGSESTAFKGIVVKHAIKIRERGSSVLVVDCRDEVVKMTSVCKSKYFKDSKDSEIIEEIIDAYSIEKDIETTTVMHGQMVQYNCSDWDFVQCRAEANGLLCMADDGKLTIKKPEFSADSVVDFQFGATILDLDAEIDARLQYKAVKGATWDFTNQEILGDVEAAEPTIPQAGNLSGSELADVLGDEDFTLYNGGKMPEPELQQWVNAKLLRHRMSLIRGKVTTAGTLDVLPGKIVTLQGAGDRFDGKLFVTAVRHQFEQGDWKTITQFGINPEWFVQTYTVQQPLAGGLLPAIQGLHAGIVTQLEGDPDGEERILVRIPIIHKEDEGAWCRISTIDAGNERGMIFRPELNDEVLVGFINSDPRHGVVLGMMHSSALPAHLPASDDNHEKGYQSRSKMKLIFNDDKKSILIETPGGHKVSIDEDAKKIEMEDLHGNKITMDDKGITIESIKDIILKASTELNMEAGTNATLKGGAQTKVEGGSGAEVSSGGTTNVKGSMINLN